MKIKLRAWNRIVGRYSEVLTLEEFHKQEKVNFMILDFELFSGFKDNSGVDIFAGDIVDGNLDNIGYEYIEKVIFNNGIFCYASDEDIETFFIHDAIDGRIKVIGNIHENPELLEDP